MIFLTNKALLLITCLVFLHQFSFGQSGIPTYQFGSCNAFNQSVMNLPCGQTCFDIKLQAPHIKQTSDYLLSSICYNPYPWITGTGTEYLPLYCDDIYSSTQTLPFSFCFYDS